MQDRVPASGRGGRVSLATENITVRGGVLKIADDDGILFGILGHADSATVAGSMYNKANVLPTAVTSAFGLTDVSAEPKDAFLAIDNRIKAANRNISTVTNLVNGNYADIAASDVGTHSTGQNDGHSDWRTAATAKTDFLISFTYINGRTSGNTVRVYIGDVSFSRDISGEINGGINGGFSGRFWRSGGIWFVMWKDGVFDWVADSNTAAAVVVKASIDFASDYNAINIKSLTVSGR